MRPPNDVFGIWFLEFKNWGVFVNTAWLKNGIYFQMFPNFWWLKKACWFLPWQYCHFADTKDTESQAVLCHLNLLLCWVWNLIESSIVYVINRWHLNISPNSLSYKQNYIVREKIIRRKKANLRKFIGRKCYIRKHVNKANLVIPIITLPILFPSFVIN